MPNEEKIHEDRISFPCPGFDRAGRKCNCIVGYPHDKAMNKLKEMDRLRANKKAEPFCIRCPDCGSLDYVKEYKQKPRQYRPNLKVKDYLECIAYTGPLRADATGYINDGRNTLYIDIYGNMYTRQEFIDKYGNDPALHILKVIELVNRVPEIIDDDATRF
jgi:hypothetical protein